MTPKGREDMVRAVVDHDLTKAAAARRFDTTVGCRMESSASTQKAFAVCATECELIR
jgi:hypothetical protein